MPIPLEPPVITTTDSGSARDKGMATVYPEQAGSYRCARFGPRPLTGPPSWKRRRFIDKKFYPAARRIPDTCDAIDPEVPMRVGLVYSHAEPAPAPVAVELTALGHDVRVYEPGEGTRVPAGVQWERVPVEPPGSRIVTHV